MLNIVLFFVGLKYRLKFFFATILINSPEEKTIVP